MSRVLMIVHDRSQIWYRQLHGRIIGDSIRWVETTTTEELVRALDLASTPIVLITLEEWIRPGLLDLVRVSEQSPGALSIVIDPIDRPGVGLLARELGATLPVGRDFTPPRVAQIVERWIVLAARRAEAEGWTPRVDPDPDTWQSWLAALIENPPSTSYLQNDAPPRTDPDARA